MPWRRHPLAQQTAAYGLGDSEGRGKMAIYLAFKRRGQFCVALIARAAPASCDRHTQSCQSPIASCMLFKAFATLLDSSPCCRIRPHSAPFWLLYESRAGSPHPVRAWRPPCVQIAPGPRHRPNAERRTHRELQTRVQPGTRLRRFSSCCRLPIFFRMSEPNVCAAL